MRIVSQQQLENRKKSSKKSNSSESLSSSEIEESPSSGANSEDSDHHPSSKHGFKRTDTMQMLYDDNNGDDSILPDGSNIGTLDDKNSNNSTSTSNNNNNNNNNNKRGELKHMESMKFMSKREMTSTQEIWNMLTMIPNPLFCGYFLLSGAWLSQSMIDDVRAKMENDGVDYSATMSLSSVTPGESQSSSSFYGFGTLLDDNNGCVQSSWFPNLHALPPLPIVMVFIAVAIHAPFAMWYHWNCAMTLPQGLPRLTHLSRRLDNSFIHVSSAIISFGTSGSWKYFLVNVAYNMECIYTNFLPDIVPKRNQIRIVFSILAYFLPLLMIGQTWLFMEGIALLVSGFLVFATYPFGGWSHCAFHIILAALPPLLMQAQPERTIVQLEHAAKCAILHQDQQQYI